MATGRSGTLRAVAGASLILGVLAACTTSASDPPGPPPRSLETGVASSPNCPDVTGQSTAAAGVLSMGPFDSDEVGRRPSGPSSRKVWVASERPGRDAAVLEVTDPQHRTVSQRRRSGEASAEGVAQFYPGSIRTPLTGAYQLRLTIGRDTMCVLVRYEL